MHKLLATQRSGAPHAPGLVIGAGGRPEDAGTGVEFGKETVSSNSIPYYPTAGLALNAVQCSETGRSVFGRSDRRSDLNEV